MCQVSRIVHVFSFGRFSAVDEGKMVTFRTFVSVSYHSFHPLFPTSEMKNILRIFGGFRSMFSSNVITSRTDQMKAKIILVAFKL